MEAEIKGLDLTGQTLMLGCRLSLPFTRAWMWAPSTDLAPDQFLPAGGLVPIKPLEPALAFLDKQDANVSGLFHVVGSGLAGVESPSPSGSAGLGVAFICWHNQIASIRSPKPFRLREYWLCNNQLALRPPLPLAPSQLA